MPAKIVKKLAKGKGISVDEAEKRWDKAQKITQDQTGMSEDSGDDFWAYVVGVFKKSMGVKAHIDHIFEKANQKDIEVASNWSELEQAFISIFDGDAGINTRKAIDNIKCTKDQAHEDAEGHANRILNALDGINGSILASALPEAYRAKKMVPLVGQKVKNTTDLAVAAQIYRNPSFETFRLFFVKDDTIVGQTGITSRMPGGSAVYPDGVDKMQYLGELNKQMNRVGATGFYLLHNHPSGNLEISDADHSVTRTFAYYVQGFLGHVVVNEKKYSFTDQYGNVEIKDIADVEPEYDLTKPAKSSPVLGSGIKNHIDIARIGTEYYREDYVAIVGIGTRGKVNGLAEIHNSELESMELGNLSDVVQKFQRQTASTFVCFSNVPNNYEEIMKKCVNNGILIDAVMESGISLNSSGIFALPSDKRDIRPKVYEANGDELFESAKLDKEIHKAAASPKNNLQEPTEEQKKIGNYKKGHIKIAGLDISIENPKGSVRSGVDKNGVKWSIELKHHYGYIKGTIGKDKDHVDVFINFDVDKEEIENRPVFIIDQVDIDGDFDEHKCLLGFNNKTEAKKAYLANYEHGWTGLGAISKMTIDEFKEWVIDKKQTQKSIIIESANRESFDYGCIMVNLPESFAQETQTFAYSIPIDDVALDDDSGEPKFEKYSHITVKYGILPVEISIVIGALQAQGKVGAVCGNLGVFQSEGYDVLFVEVDSPDLVSLNQHIIDSLPCANLDYKNYVPHITLAYLKSGAGEQYKGISTFEGTKLIFDSVTYSNDTNDQFTIDLS